MSSTASRDPVIRLAKPMMGLPELRAVERVMLSGIYTNGPETAAFEDEFATAHQVPHAVAVANGTVALAAMYTGHGIGPGDEVIVPSMTFLSTATSVLHVGARPVFAEVDERTLNIDPEHAATLIGARTRAIVAVHYGGQPADMDALRQVAESAGVLLFEDAAEAHGACYRGRPVGGLADAAMFSFTPTKNITTGEGGIVTTHDAEYAVRLRRLRNHGIGPDGAGSGLGHNWRITEFQAAMGREQLRRLDGILVRKRANAELFGRLLAEAGAQVLAPEQVADRTHTYMLFTLRSANRRDEIVAGLRAAGIEAKLYFPPAHLHPVFADRKVSLPRTEHLAKTLFSVPFHAQLDESDLAVIATKIAAFSAA
jgi:perosamine synthetase